MAKHISYLIIGNGIAGVTAAETLRAEDPSATIAVIADDPFPVYYRPALKDYLSGRLREEKLWARPASFYQNHNIYFVSDRVVGIQPGQRFVQLQSGKQIGYQHLLLANGARASTLNCPGQDLEGVYTLRSVADYQKVLQHLGHVRHVVVSGGGTLALETIETLRHRGLEVTHLVRRRTLWSEVLDATASDLVLLQEQRDGVTVYLEEEIAEISGKGGRVNGVTTSHDRRVPCEMVIIAIGIQPDIKFIQASGISCGIGVRVDEAMRTTVPGVYAAGDVLETTHPLTRRTRAVGQWYPAIQQARAAAYSMLGLLDPERPFSASTFYNATFLYGLDFAAVGITHAPGAGYQELVADPEPRSYRKVLLKDGAAVGALALGNRGQVLDLKRAIDHRVDLTPIAGRLFASDFKLNDWLDLQGVPPALLGASRLDARSARSVSHPGVREQATPEPTIEVAPIIIKKRVPLEALLVHEPDRVTGLNLAETRLGRAPVLIGRQPGVHLLIDQGAVSRLHAGISYVDGQYVLRDLGSANGTFINDIRLEPSRAYTLQDGDQVRFGKLIRFRFVLRTQRHSGSSPSLAGVSRLQELNSEPPVAPHGQPLLDTDGSLLLPGASTPLPPTIVALFERSPGLVVLTGALDSHGKRPPLVYRLRQGRRVILGRDKQNDIELADVVVSRRHAEIVPGPEGFYVRDLGSSNGVSVNEAKIDNPYLLTHGDRILLGGSVVFFIDLQDNWLVTEKVAVSPETVPVVASRAKEGGQAYVYEPPSAQRKDGAPRMITCPRCGIANTHVARFCASCSAPLSSGVR
ncbi:MAG: FAD-dependent oxidoreductase [Ktedonobacteraceae bacterium]|nr:FAD-dependent oxidoreductase [Ktedonobacteraceae bacterium]